MVLIDRLLIGFASRLRAFYFRTRGMRIEGNCWLRAIEVPRHHAAIRLASGVALDRGVVLLVSGERGVSEKITIGERTYINRSTMLDASDRIEIGARCMIGPFCYITDHDHAVARGADPGAGPLISVPTKLEERCWLGAHVTVLKGVTIGSGTVVGAGSVVTKSLPADVVAVGSPARVIRQIET